MTARLANLTGAHPLYWTCERCGAVPGSACRAPGGRAASAHASRRQQVYRWERYGRGYEA